MSDRNVGRDRAASALLVAFVLVLGLQAILVQHLNINWDEFYFLSLIHDTSRGVLWRDLQTLHVHFFGWLVNWPTNEVAQVIAGRWVMFLAEIGTLGFIYGISRMFVSRFSAGFAALTWLTAGFTLAHGFSFRTDPLAAFFLMGALWLGMSRPLSILRAALVGLSIAISGLITIKAVLYAPAFLGVLLWQTKHEGLPLKQTFAAVFSLIIGFAGMYVLHRAGLAPAPETSAAVASDAVRTTLLEAGLFPRRAEIIAWLIFSVGPIVLFVLGASRSLNALAFALPLVSLVVYRNAFPYFFPFISAPAMITVAIGAERLRTRPILLFTLGLMMAASVSFQTWVVRSNDQSAQRQLVLVVHQIFREPVPYIDRNAMIASFPWQGFFMSTWGMLKYRAEGVPVMENILANTSPPLLIANGPALAAAMQGIDGPGALLAEDAEVLRGAYLPYWGPVFVAGLNVNSGPMQVLIGGSYRVATSEPVKIDGEIFKPNAVAVLSIGTHQVTTKGDEQLRLIWATAEPAPEMPPIAGPIYSGF